MSDKNKTFMESINNVLGSKMIPVLMNFFNKPIFNILKNSMVSVMPFILVGSLMLLISLLGTTSMGTEKPILPFLEKYTEQIGLLNSMTMGFMTLYFAVSIGINFAEQYKLDKTSCALLNLMSFLMINIDVIVDGKIDVSYFGAKGVFPTMITSLIALNIYKVFIKKNIRIKMPESVPPAVGQAFSSLIPYAVVAVFYWFIRTILHFDFTVAMQYILQPVFAGADNIVAFALYVTFSKILWSFGIHADSMFQGILDPLKLTWIAENGVEVTAGNVIPHIWTTAVERTCLWTGPVLGLLVVLMFSKVKHLKAFSLASFPAAMFSIVEPVIFGLPLMMNPILFVPFILSGFVCAVFTYGVILFGIVAKPFLELPWATPPLLIGFISSGDWKYILLTIINILIGVIIYYPFVKTFEKQELKRIEEEGEV